MSTEHPKGGTETPKCASLALHSTNGRHIATSFLLLVLLAGTLGACNAPHPKQAGSVTPATVREQIIPQEDQATAYALPLSLDNTQRFIDYFNSSQLTAEQEMVKKEALSALRAPCCDDNTMYDC